MIRGAPPLKPFEPLNTASPTFELLEMPSTAETYRALYDELDGEKIELDLDDDDDDDVF